jgi:hypothetical protein
MVYGVSTKGLAEFVTSDKDILRGINRSPSEFYLLDDSGNSKRNDDEKLILEDQDLDDFFDFVMIDMDEIKN